MHLPLLPFTLLPDIILWIPLGILIVDTMWNDVRTGIIPHRGPCCILLWCIIMRYAKKINLFPLSTLIMGLFFLSISAFFWYRRGKHIMGGGDLKLIMACSLMVCPTNLGLWMTFIGIGSLLTNTLYRSTTIPMAPAIGFSFALLLLLTKN